MLMAVLSFGMLLLLVCKFYTNSKQQKYLKNQEHEVLMGMKILLQSNIYSFAQSLDYFVLQELQLTLYSSDTPNRKI